MWHLAELNSEHVPVKSIFILLFLAFLRRDSVTDQSRMAAFAEGSERFVEIPGIVEIRWISDDPDYYVEPEDLFDKQAEGLPDW